jgi:chromosome partitioning protein
VTDKALVDSELALCTPHMIACIDAKRDEIVVINQQLNHKFSNNFMETHLEHNTYPIAADQAIATPRRLACVVAVANQKGGVGKTTSTINLAHALIALGQKVLVIDSDPQSSLSVICGIDPAQMRELDDAGRTLYFGLVKNVALSTLVMAGGLTADGAHPSLIPASIRLANAEQELVSPFGTANILQEKLLPLKHDFDVILIDCPPTLSLLTVNALTAADAVLIPCKTDFMSVYGISLLLDTIENVQRRANPQLKVLGILPTLFNATAKHDNEVLHELRRSVAHKNIETFEPVHRSTVFDKSNLENRAAIELYPNNKGISAYRAVAQKIIAGQSSPAAHPQTYDNA